MAKTRTIKPRPSDQAISPFQWLMAATGLVLALWLLSNVAGFIVMVGVAFAIGQASNRILPAQIPYGYLGSTGVGLAGAVLGTRLLGQWGPSVAGLRLIPGVLGALILTVALQYKLNSDRAKSLEVIKAKADPNDPFLMKELDGYILTEHLGSGSNAKVYLGVPADNLSRESAVACKILNEEAKTGKDTLARYGREIRIAHKLDHPGIVKMYSWGEQSNLLFIIMEYVEGGTLSHLIEPGGMPLEKVRDIMGQLGSALQHAHDQSIVHRDIKPANILVSNGRCKISDFGLGRALQDDVSLTKEGTVLGTPAYIAPEQIQGKKPTSACDQYALGVLFYEILTGQRPFISNDSVALLMMQLQETPTNPRELRPEIPEPLAAIVMKMMEKEPTARFPSVKHMLLALRDLDDKEDEKKFKEEEARKKAEAERLAAEKEAAERAEENKTYDF
jgi:serine/threonine protein kinase/uncharacterized membrane protein YeaQ/YmgE (transglycosylase-associated protein family)